MDGSSASTTVIPKEQPAVFPEVSTTLYDTVEAPTGNTLPDERTVVVVVGIVVEFV